jgi:phosphopantetheinyl transferase
VVSLAHSDGHAVAVAAPGGDLGVDLELLRERAAGFADAAFHAAELELLASVPEAERDAWTLRCFCAKEAVAKALGTGLLRSPRDLQVTAVDPTGETVDVTLGGELAALRPDLADAALRVHALRADDLIVTTTVCEKGGAPR